MFKTFYEVGFLNFSYHVYAKPMNYFLTLGSQITNAKLKCTATQHAKLALKKI